jgi:hypothetical protein
VVPEGDFFAAMRDHRAWRMLDNYLLDSAADATEQDRRR